MSTKYFYVTLMGLAVAGGGCALFGKTSLSDVQQAAQKAQELEQMHAKCTQLKEAALDPEALKALSDNVGYKLIRKYGGALDPETNPDLATLSAEKKDQVKKLVLHVNTICRAVAKDSPRAELKRKVLVLNSDSVNAFSTPLHTFITVGYLKTAKNEDQIKFICGHEEEGHADHDDMVNTFKEANIRDCQKAFTTGVVGAVADVGPVRDQWRGLLDNVNKSFSLPVDASGALTTAGKKLLDGGADLVVKAMDAGYNKDQEKRADQFGFEAALRAKADPNAMFALFDIVPKTDALFANHPAPRERKQELQTFFRSLNPNASGNKGDFSAYAGEWPFTNRNPTKLSAVFDVLKGWKSAHIPANAS